MEKNKTGSYLKYALGEIVLVMIGILLALQVNNWNETRKLREEEKKIFYKILSDLKSDSIQIEKTIMFFKKSQDLYYHLYQEMKGNASYDSTLAYGRIRYSPPFNSFLVNDQSIFDKIVNEQVRHNISAYYRSFENDRQVGIGQFLELQINYVRPYLTANNIVDIDALFSIPRYENNDINRVISYEALKSHFHTPEFARVLSELRMKSAASIQSLVPLKEENHKLQNTIREALLR